MPKRLLITGFDPFGGQSVNPAWEAVSRLPARVGDCVVHALQVPTVFGLAAQRVIDLPSVRNNAFLAAALARYQAKFDSIAMN